MITSELIQLSYQYAVGEATPPDSDDDNYTMLFNSANAFIETWQDEVDSEGNPINWNSLWDRTNLSGNVSATDTFALDPAIIRKLSTEEDGVKVTGPNGQVVHYTVVQPKELYKGGNICARKGNNLVFAEAFSATSVLIGGTISVPYFGFAQKLDAEHTTVPVDQPMWLVFRVAAEFARNDVTKQNLSPGLVAEANNVMKSMIANNLATQDEKISHGSYRPLGQTT